MVSEGHKPGITATHTCCAGNTWYVEVEEKEMEGHLSVDMQKDVVTCEVPFGGMVLLNNSIPHRSLENFSDKIRWSIDLRWQDPKKPTGFYDLKGYVMMRKADDPNYQIDWKGKRVSFEKLCFVVPSLLYFSPVYIDFALLDRTKLQEQSTAETVDNYEFDTNIHGPWMNRWDITHHNKHTDTMKREISWSSPSPGDKA